MKPLTPTMNDEEIAKWKADIERGYETCSEDGCVQRVHNCWPPRTTNNKPVPMYCYAHWWQKRYWTKVAR